MSESKAALNHERDYFRDLFHGCVTARYTAEEEASALRTAIFDAIHSIDNPGATDVRGLLVAALVENSTGMTREMAAHALAMADKLLQGTHIRHPRKSR
jgi:hypothetical protein